MREDVTIYCIRHGETDWNAERRYQGQADIPLNELGRVQARRNGQALRALLPTLAEADFVSSPLSRARETMEIVRQELELPPSNYRLEPRLIEVDYGEWQGQLLSDLERHVPAAIAGRAADPFNWRPRLGESYADLTDRMSAWLDGVERDTVLATHGGISRVLRCHVLGLDTRSILDLEVPQDRVLVIGKGRMSWL